MRQLFAFPTIVISLLLTVLSAFFGLSLPAGLKGLDGYYVWAMESVWDNDMAALR